MYAEERQQAMAELVARRGRVSVADLAAQFGVTTETVRRDLDLLESLRLLRRVHGGALPADSFTVMEAGLSDRGLSNPDQKRRIARTPGRPPSCSPSCSPGTTS
jgi:DeoR family fructose operon transcriptional repressor